MNSRVRRTREIARECYMDANGDVEQAKSQLEVRLRSEFGSIIGTIAIISVLLQFGIALINFWKLLHLSVPPVDPADNEPTLTGSFVGPFDISSMGVEGGDNADV